MKYLLDSSVLSELRKQRRCDPALTRWYAESKREGMCTSVLVIGELRRGIERLRRRDPASANALDGWLHEIRRRYSGRILPVDEAVADAWGRLGVPDPVPAVDGLLAATALVHGLVLATRNVEDVASTGVRAVNPFDAYFASR